MWIHSFPLKSHIHPASFLPAGLPLSSIGEKGTSVSLRKRPPTVTQGPQEQSFPIQSDGSGSGAARM